MDIPPVSGRTRDKKCRRRVSKRSGRSTRLEYMCPKVPRESEEPKDPETTAVSNVPPECFVCYAEADLWLNCKRGSLSRVNIKRYSKSNNPICSRCCQEILTSRVKSCPLCRSTEWTKDLDIRYPKKKKPYADRKRVKERKRAVEKREQKRLLIAKRRKAFSLHHWLAL